MAFPTASMPTRWPFGSCQSAENPISTALSRTLRHRTVSPSRLHHVSGCVPTIVCEHSSTERTQGEPSRDRVLFLMCEAGRSIPAASKARRTEMRRTGISLSRFTMAGLVMISRMRSDGVPYSAALRLRKSTRSGCLAFMSLATREVRGVLTFSTVKLSYPRRTTSSTHQRSSSAPSLRSSSVVPTLALLSSVHGGERWTCDLDVASGQGRLSASSGLISTQTALPPVFAAQWRRAVLSQSTPCITWQLDCMAPALSPPAPQSDVHTTAQPRRGGGAQSTEHKGAKLSLTDVFGGAPPMLSKGG